MPAYRIVTYFSIVLTGLSLCGCDLYVAGLFMPGLFPGVGQPFTGTVVDSATQLPVGGATVLAGLGTTVTDAAGNFKLYGSLSAKEISASRAGYTALTLGGVDTGGNDPIAIALDPLFPPDSPLPMRFLEMSGAVSGQDPTAQGIVSFGGQTTTISNSAYQISFKAHVPGKILTSVLAWGAIAGRYNDSNTAAQPFNFQNFAYEVRHWPLGETIPESRVQVPLAMRTEVPIRPVRVVYSNLAGFTAVQTDVLLDFGVVGYVPVARAMASNQAIPVPQIAGLKYVVSGEARDASSKQSSTVSITTNDPGQASFQLLPVPKILEPTAGATEVGARPTFKWTPVPVADVAYQVSLYEVGESRPKWIGSTDLPEITYPGFAANDINGGALRPDKKYTWNLTVIDILGATELPTAQRPGGVARLVPFPGIGLEPRDGPAVKPFRIRKREAEIREIGFSL